jgi:hypothetical protein
MYADLNGNDFYSVFEEHILWQNFLSQEQTNRIETREVKDRGTSNPEKGYKVFSTFTQMKPLLSRWSF